MRLFARPNGEKLERKVKSEIMVIDTKIVNHHLQVKVESRARRRSQDF